MAHSIVLPKLSDTMEAAKVVAWLKKPGDPIRKGEALLEVETEKANVEVEAEVTGVLEKIRVKDGETATVGETICVITEDLEGDSPETTEGGGKSTAPARPSRETSRVMASPAARRLARDRGVDLQEVEGSGPRGRIRRQDILSSLETAAAVGETEERKTSPSPSAGAFIAERLARSKREIPHFYVSATVDMEEAVRLRRLLAAGDAKVTFTSLIARAVARTLGRHPLLNASWDDKENRPELHEAVDLGFALESEEGLLVPVIADCAEKNVFELASAWEEVKQRSRDKKLRSRDLREGTFTISNLGMYEVEEFAAVINPPQAAILAVGSIRETPVVKGGRVEVGKTMKVVVSADHRVLGGTQAARFLGDLKKSLEEPGWMIVEAFQRKG